MKNTLSINGGGIRGIIPGSVLAALEQQTGKLTRELFSYVSGTSTGALLAAGVAAGIPASELLTVYTTRVQEMFSRPRAWLRTPSGSPTGSCTIPRRLRDVLAGVFGGAAQWTMNDCPIGICIPATAMNGHNWYFVRDGARNARTTGAVQLIDAAVARPARRPTSTTGRSPCKAQALAFFDGGTGGLANPSYQACVEMFEYDTFAPAETRLVSLGTGFYPGSQHAAEGPDRRGVVGHRHAGGQLRGLGGSRRRAAMAGGRSGSSIGNCLRISPWTIWRPFLSCSTWGKRPPRVSIGRKF